MFLLLCRNQNKQNMEFLSIPFIKQHIRLDSDCEDEYLQMLGDAAEFSIATLLNRGKKVADMINSLKEEYGEIPATLYQAGCILVAEGYKNREASSPNNQSINPYSVDRMLKPLIKLS